MFIASELTFLACVQTTNGTRPLGMSDNVLAPGGSTPTPSLESNMRSLVDCMVTMQRQQIELVEAVQRLTPPAVVSGATQATASLPATTPVPTAMLAGASSSTITTSSGIGELYCGYIYFC